MNIQRLYLNNGSLEPHIYGDYVRFSDVEKLINNAAKWQKHKGTFYQMERVLQEARPLVHLLLDVQQAAKDAT